MGKPRRAKPPAKPGEVAAALPVNRRLPMIDGLRGTAVLMMIFYHFGFDLNYLGWIHYRINYDLRWLIWRSLILGTFLFTVGVSLALAEDQKKDLKKQLARIGKLAAAALLVTAGSWLLFPDSAIYFGTLHAITLMCLLLLLFPLPAYPAAILGWLAIALGNGYAHPVFDQPALAWLGCMTHKPQTEDYVPMLPWFGVCLVGYAVAKILVRHRTFDRLARIRSLPPALVWMGRNSLAIYLVHQPLLFAVLIPVTRWLRPA